MHKIHKIKRIQKKKEKQDTSVGGRLGTTLIPIQIANEFPAPGPDKDPFRRHSFPWKPHDYLKPRGNAPNPMLTGSLNVLNSTGCVLSTAVFIQGSIVLLLISYQFSSLCKGFLLCPIISVLDPSYSSFDPSKISFIRFHFLKISCLILHFPFQTLFCPLEDMLQCLTAGVAPINHSPGGSFHFLPSMKLISFFTKYFSKTNTINGKLKVVIIIMVILPVQSSPASTISPIQFHVLSAFSFIVSHCVLLDRYLCHKWNYGN